MTHVTTLLSSLMPWSDKGSKAKKFSQNPKSVRVKLVLALKGSSKK